MKTLTFELTLDQVMDIINHSSSPSKCKRLFTGEEDPETTIIPTLIKLPLNAKIVKYDFEVFESKIVLPIISIKIDHWEDVVKIETPQVKYWNSTDPKEPRDYFDSSFDSATIDTKSVSNRTYNLEEWTEITERYKRYLIFKSTEIK